MPLYEMIMVCKVGESVHMASLLKNVSTVILQEGGVVRGVSNLGDRVLCKNLKSSDDVNYSVARFMQVSPRGTIALSCLTSFVVA